MGILLLVIIGTFLFIAAALIHSLSKDEHRQEQSSLLSPYAYTRKDYIMTMAESVFFRRLERLAGIKYYIFPQIHLSSLLEHQVKNGQDWRAALAKIQRKSVDFVLVEKTTLKTAYAIELDDRTHDVSLQRIQRDAFVDEIFQKANIPLVRLRNTKGMDDRRVIEIIAAAKVGNESA